MPEHTLNSVLTPKPKKDTLVERLKRLFMLGDAELERVLRSRGISPDKWDEIVEQNRLPTGQRQYVSDYREL